MSWKYGHVLGEIQAGLGHCWPSAVIEHILLTQLDPPSQDMSWAGPRAPVSCSSCGCVSHIPTTSRPLIFRG